MKSIPLCGFRPLRGVGYAVRAAAQRAAALYRRPHSPLSPALRGTVPVRPPRPATPTPRRSRTAAEAAHSEACEPRACLPALYLISTAFLLLLAKAAWACPACSEAIASQGDALTRGWARSIFLMMGAPYLLFTGVTFYVVRSARRARGARPPQ